MAMVITSLFFVSFGSLVLYFGLKLAGVMRAQFEELMSQRMVDYSGFVDVPKARD